MATRGRHRHAPGIMHACVYLYIQLAIPTYLAATGMMGGKAGRLNQNVWGRGSDANGELDPKQWGEVAVKLEV